MFCNIHVHAQLTRKVDVSLGDWDGMLYGALPMYWQRKNVCGAGWSEWFHCKEHRPHNWCSFPPGRPEKARLCDNGMCFFPVSTSHTCKSTRPITVLLLWVIVEYRTTYFFDDFYDSYTLCFSLSMHAYAGCKRRGSSRYQIRRNHLEAASASRWENSSQ